MSALPKHEPMTFYKGLVTNGEGEPSQTSAYVTYGSAHGDNPEDAEIVIDGGGAAKAASAIEAIPDMLRALRLFAAVDFDRFTEHDELLLADARREAEAVIAKAEQPLNLTTHADASAQHES